MDWKIGIGLHVDTGSVLSQSACQVHSVQYLEASQHLMVGQTTIMVGVFKHITAYSVSVISDELSENVVRQGLLE